MSPDSSADLSAGHRAPGLELERDGGGRISLAGLKDSVARHDKFKAKHDLGVIRRVGRQVKVAGHVDQVLAAARAL